MITPVQHACQAQVLSIHSAVNKTTHADHNLWISKRDAHAGKALNVKAMSPQNLLPTLGKQQS